MECSTIELPPLASSKMLLRAQMHQNTREARGGQEEYWQQCLRDLDESLILRFNPRTEKWSVWYDYKGRISCLCTFGKGDSFARVMHRLRKNAWMDSKSLQEEKLIHEMNERKRQDDLIDDCAGEFAEELHHATRERVISDATIEPQHRKGAS